MTISGVDDAPPATRSPSTPPLAWKLGPQGEQQRRADQFGYAMAVAGDTVVVGAGRGTATPRPSAATAATTAQRSAGAAYVFVYNAGVWSEQAYLEAANAEAGDAFGSAVAIAGDSIVVGARRGQNANTIDGDGGNNSNGEAGAACVFVRSGATWTQQAYLKAANSGANDWFGYAVAIDGDTVLVGAPARQALPPASTATAPTTAPLPAPPTPVRSGVAWSQLALSPRRATRRPTTTSVGPCALRRECADRCALRGQQCDRRAVTAPTTAHGMPAPPYASYAAARRGASRPISRQQHRRRRPLRFTPSLSGESGVPRRFHREQQRHHGQRQRRRQRLRPVRRMSQRAAARHGASKPILKAANAEAYDEFGASGDPGATFVAAGATMEDGGATGVNGNGADNSVPDSGAAYVFLRNGATGAAGYLKAANRTPATSSARRGAGRRPCGHRRSLEDSAGTTINGDGSDNSAEDAGAAYVFGSLIAGDVTIGLSVAPATARPGQTITYTSPSPTTAPTRRRRGDNPRTAPPASSSAVLPVRASS